MESIFWQFAFILAISSVFGFIILKLRLPLIVSYLLTGVTLSFLPIFDTTQSVVLHIFPDIGIAFVLFLIGMELDFREIKTLGKPIIISGLGQVIISTFLGFAIADLLGFKPVESFYIGLGLAISSTVVVIKMLLEKKDTASIYGKLSIGISLVEDLISIIVLMFISISGAALTIGVKDLTPFGILLLKGTILFFTTYLIARFVARYIFASIAKSTELLFFTAIAWCFLFTTYAQFLGFSVEIGAFLAGVALASSPYHFQIQGKIKPLRDFFLALFFIYLGSQVQLGDLKHGWLAIIIFTLCALLLKPFIYLLFLSIFGFRRHTLFQTSLNLSQISEFSLIILLVGVQAGIVSSYTLSIMASVGVLSIVSSVIIISHGRSFYKLISPLIRFFEHENKIHFLEASPDGVLEDHIVIIGAHNIATPILEYLKEKDIPFIVMDVNPHFVKKLQEEGINAMYGDISDPEVLETLHIQKAKLIISTVSYLQDNEVLLHECRKVKTRAKIVVRGADKEQAKLLKGLGADYVILPEKVAGIYLVNQIKANWPTVEFEGYDQ
jgi:Kef-type K+ transport system membrane component KefB